MAGPAIRAYELARHLAEACDVAIASLQPKDAEFVADIPVHVGLGGTELAALARTFDILLAGGFIFAQHPALTRMGKYLVLDLYDPMLIEDLVLQRGRLGRFVYDEHHRWLEKQMRLADFMVCASDRQRDYWLGRLCSLARLGPEVYADDVSARRAISVVPFGLSSTPPTPGLRRMRGVLPGVGEGDRLFLWGGGIWDWFDPLTPIRAMATLRASRPDLKLVFMAGRSPNPTTPEMPMARHARALAAELGVLGTSVHFLDEWIPYETRGSLLLEADAAFTAHFDHLETRFSFRTRVLDYLWAGLPILTTAGDSMADLVDRRGLGMAIAPGDVQGWEQAIARMGSDDAWRSECRRRVLQSREAFHWEKAIAPLIEYVRSPYRTPRARRSGSWFLKGPVPLMAKAFMALEDEGLSALVHRGKRYMARRSRGPAGV